MMKQLTFTLFSLLFMTLQAYAINPVINYALFNTPEVGSYIETQLLIPGSGVTFAPNDKGALQASIEVVMLFKQGETIVKFDKYMLISPESDAPKSKQFNFIDVKRNVLADGEYELEINFTDINNTQNTATFSETITMGYPDYKVGMSDIVLLEDYKKTETENDFSKNGLDLIPNVLNYFPDHANRLIFYTEIYHTDKWLEDPNYLVVFAIKHHEKGGIAYNLRSFKKMEAAPVNIVLSEFNIDKLPSGNYDLQIEVRDKKNELIGTKKVFFQRNKKAIVQDMNNIEAVEIENTFAEEMDAEDVKYYVAALAPISGNAGEVQIENVLEANNITYLRRYLYNFWAQRDQYAPYEAFLKYKEQVDAVENQFSSQLYRGFESDRGRVYLQYGTPNDVINVPNEPGAYPYMIWHYYDFSEVQRSVKFVFFTPNMADNDYELIHSDAYGEMQDTRWKLRVNNQFKEQSGSSNFDNSGVRDHFGKKIDALDGF